MKIKNRIMSFLLIPVLMVSAFILPVRAYEESYVNHWAYKEIRFLVEQDIVWGYPDGSIRPDNLLSGSEYSYLFNRAITYYEANENSLHNSNSTKHKKSYNNDKIYTITDLNGLHNCVTRAGAVKTCLVILNEYSDDENVLDKALELGLVIGYPDGEMKMEENITRAEAFVLIYRMINIQNEQETDISKFPASFINPVLDLTDGNKDSGNNEYNDSKDNTGKDESNNNQDNKDEGLGTDDGIDDGNESENNNPQNMAPSKPVIEINSNNTEIIEGDLLVVTAYSTDPEGDEITYVWENREEEAMVYPVGNNLVRVKAVDSNGNESEWAEKTIVVVNAMIDINSDDITEQIMQYEYDAPYGYITRYSIQSSETVEVTESRYCRIDAFNEKNNTWEKVYEDERIDGIIYSGSLEFGKYTKVRYYYDMPDYYLDNNMTVTTYTVVFYQ